MQLNGLTLDPTDTELTDLWCHFGNFTKDYVEVHQTYNNHRN